MKDKVTIKIKENQELSLVKEQCEKIILKDKEITGKCENVYLKVPIAIVYH